MSLQRATELVPAPGPGGVAAVELANGATDRTTGESLLPDTDWLAGTIELSDRERGQVVPCRT